MALVADQLPHAYHLLVPDLAGMDFPVEVVADCAHCPMAPVEGGDPNKPYRFTSEVRCCTYNPSLPNFLIGRILRRGDAGARQMLRRLQDLDGVHAERVGPGKASALSYVQRSRHEFGRMDDYRCPYWVEGEYHCSIWQDRGSVCRTWHCKHVDGARGHRVWSALKDVLEWMERTLARLCVQRGQPPAKDASRDDFIAWFLWCAAYVDSLDQAELDALKNAGLNSRVIQLRAWLAERDHPIPEVLVPTIASFDREPDVVRITSYSSFDTHDVPKWIFLLFSKMTDRRPWREALALAEAELGAPIGEEFVRFLFQHGLVSIQSDHEFKPGMHLVTRVPRRTGYFPNLPPDDPFPDETPG